MTKPAAPEVTGPAVAAGQALVKALSGFRFYAPGHPALNELMKKFGEVLRATLASTGTLELFVNADALEVQGANVLAGADGGIAWARPLALAGVRRVSILPDVADSALQTLLSTWFAATQKTLPEGYDFFSAIWESGIDGVELDAPSLELVETGLDVPSIERRESAFVATATEARISEGGTQSDVRAWTAALGVPDAATSNVSQDATASDLQALRSELNTEAGDEPKHALSVAWWLLCDATASEEPRLLEFLDACLTRQLEQGRWHRVSQAFRSWVDDCKRTPGYQPFYLHACRALLAHRAAIVAALGDQTQEAFVVELIKCVPVSMNDALLPLLEGARPSARLPLATQFAGRSHSLDAIVRMVDSLRADDAPWLTAILSKHSDRAKLGEALLGSASEALVALAINHLAPSKRVEEVIERLLASNDVKVLEVGASYVERHELGAFVPALAAALTSNRPGPVIDRCVTCLSRIGSRQASAALLSAAANTSLPEPLRVSAINGVAAIADPLARTELERLTKGFFTPRLIRTTAKMALSRLPASAR